MSAPMTLPSLSPPVLDELGRRYEEACNAETRTRYQMILLATSGYRVPQIARLVLRSEDTVARVLKRFMAGGFDAVPRRPSPGRRRTITQEWEAELVRVIEQDPHEAGQETANWTTEMLADFWRSKQGLLSHKRQYASTYMLIGMSASALRGHYSGKPKRKWIMWENDYGWR
jgi:transposase